jgi:hypothetical protein
MAAGHIVNGQCVDVAASADMYFSHFVPVAMQVLNSQGEFDVLQLSMTKDAGQWFYLQFQNEFLIGSFPSAVPAFATCDTTTEFFDGMSIGWAVVAAMVAAYAVNFLRRAL